MAVDAGASGKHLAEFYALLAEEGLPLPGVAVLTHWHWDHSFGLHKASGLPVAHARTAAHLRDEQRRFVSPESLAAFRADDPCFSHEYGDGPICARLIHG